MQLSSCKEIHIVEKTRLTGASGREMSSLSIVVLELEDGKKDKRQSRARSLRDKITPGELFGCKIVFLTSPDLPSLFDIEDAWSHALARMPERECGGREV